MKLLAGLLLLMLISGFGQSPDADLDRLLAGVERYRYGDSREPLEDFNQWLRSQRDPSVVARAEARLAALLESTTNPATIDFACRHLAVIGTSAAVPALAKRLLSPATTEIARFALDRIPGPEAEAALLDAVAQLSSPSKIGVIHSLGQRKSKRTQDTLLALLADQDAEVSVAAASSLALQGDRISCAAIDKVRLAAAGVVRQRYSEALLDCASRLPASSNFLASGYFTLLLEPLESLPIRTAALHSLARSNPNAALPQINKYLGTPADPMETTAAAVAAGIPSPAAKAALLQALPKASEQAQLIIVAGLGPRGGPAVQQALLHAANSASPLVRQGAVRALGECDDPGVIFPLARIAAEQEALRPAARAALVNLRAKGADMTFLKFLIESSGDTRLELIRAIAERGISGAASPLLLLARDSDPTLRAEALRALRESAGPNDVPALAALLESPAGASERSLLEAALSAALLRSGGTAVEQVIAAYSQSSSPEARRSYLASLGATASPAALAHLRKELQSGDAQIRRASILGLSEWNHGEPAPDLLAAAQRETQLALHVLAMRGFARLAALPSSRSPAESVAMIASAMQAARRAEEKKALLGVLPRYAGPEAIAIARAAVDDPEIAAEAKASLERMQRSQQTPRTAPPAKP